MKTEFLKKEHWRQGDDCTFVQFTGKDGTELFAEFETSTSVRVWGKIANEGVCHEVEVLVTADGIYPTTGFIKASLSMITTYEEIARVMFSDEYQTFRKGELAFENLKDVRKEMYQLRIWEAKFEKELAEARGKCDRVSQLTE